MKRVFLFISSIILACSMSAQESNHFHIIGDVNGDNKLDMLDVAQLVDVLLGKSEQKHIYTFEDFLVNNSITGTFIVDGKERTYTCGHESVDLGLPSGMIWAAANVGASLPHEYGNYYAWAETSAYGEAPTQYPSSWSGKRNDKYLNLSKKQDYSWSNYKWGVSSSVLYKYVTNATRGEVDDIELLEPEDDVANVEWGKGWRIPTNDEIGELRANCYWKWTDDYKDTGVKGYIVYKVKATADKGKFSYNKPSLAGSYTMDDTHIFLPVCGYRANDSWLYVNTYGGYWSSTLYDSGSNEAYYLMLSSSNCFRTHYDRNYARSVRAVYPAK